MKLLIVTERQDRAAGLSALLVAMGHEPHVTEVHDGDLDGPLSGAVAAVAPAAILLDAPRATPFAVAAVSTLQGDSSTRLIPTVLLTGATGGGTRGWTALQRSLDNRICTLPFHGAPDALYRLLGVLHGLTPPTSAMIGQ
jgi:hypothetical protein